MRRTIVVVATGLLSTMLTAGVAQAATPAKPKVATTAPTKAAPDGPRHWYAVAGERRTEASAKELLAKLEAKHFEGFETRNRKVRRGIDHLRRDEVERIFPDRRAAQAEAKRLREAGFPGRIAHERG
jgi:hypothetical protein